MNLEQVNSHLLKQICVRLNLPPHSEINSSFCEGVCRKLKFSPQSEICTPADLVTGLSKLGLDLSHVNIDKVLSRDELHTYLLLDILSVLIDSKSPSTKQNLQKLIEKNGQQIHPQGFTLEDTPNLPNIAPRSFSLKGKNLPKVVPRAFSFEEDKGGTTSGGEEVSKILQEAERKYGQVKSFRKNTNKEKLSPIGSAPVVDTNKWGKENLNLSSIEPKKYDENKDYRKNESTGKTKLNAFERKTRKTVDKSQLKKSQTDVKGTGENSENTLEVDGVGSFDTVLEASDDVTIKIPQEGGEDVVVKVKSLEGKSLKNRRIHVRVHEESAQTPKRMKYGRKAVLAHHLRKNRSPMFSNKPKPIPPTKKEVMEKVAEELRKKRKNEEIEEENLRVAKKIRDTKTSVQCKLSTQRLIRENRTRTAQLRKLGTNLPS